VNYTSLKQDIANHFVSTEIVPFIPTAIALAEADLNRRVRARDMLERAYFVLTNSYAPLPSDFLEARTLYITASGYTTRLEFLTIEEMQRKKGEEWIADRPVYYSVLGSEIELLPTLSGSFTLDMAYYQTIPGLSDVSPTNWLVDKHPDLYLWGTLLQAAPYMYQDKRVPMWSTAYEAALESLRVSNARSEFSGGVLKARAKAL